LLNTGQYRAAIARDSGFARAWADGDNLRRPPSYAMDTDSITGSVSRRAAPLR
jgi:hypothetical protein